jgi:PAS domain S-box-containing protein
MKKVRSPSRPRSPTEEALRQSDLKFRLMADNAPVMIWVSGPDKLCTWFNKPWLDFTGRTMEQERGEGWAQGVFPEDLDRCLHTYVAAFDARQPFTMDYRLRRHDGDYRWILDNGIPLYGSSGVFQGYIGSCVDITDSKQAAERFESVLQAAPVAMILLDRSGRIILVNAQVERLFGYAREELLGQAVELLIPPRFRGAHPKHRDNFFAEPRARAMGLGRDLSGLRKDGIEVPVEIGLSPVYTESEMLMLASVIDISERKDAEERLRASHKQQRDLANRLLRAQELERRRLAREMHDDLTQRLAVMAIEVGKLEQQPGLQLPTAESLRRARDELIKLSQDVHSLSRQLHPSILDDLGLADALRSECAAFQQREGITAVLSIKNVPANLSNDTAVCLYRIAQEALRNVSRHSGAGRVEVTLIGGEQEVVLRIRDEGKGFDAQRTRSQGGLGLASMEERARLVEADLVIDSELGKGTTVIVVAPRHRKEP